MTVSGVRVGRVDAIDYDMHSYEAVVSLRIDNNYDTFPEDTSASIFTAGLLGEQYIALEPGGSMNNLKPGDRIQLTQSALVMEQVIGQFLYSSAARNTRGARGREPGAGGPDQPCRQPYPDCRRSAVLSCCCCLRARAPLSQEITPLDVVRDTSSRMLLALQSERPRIAQDPGRLVRTGCRDRAAVF